MHTKSKGWVSGPLTSNVDVICGYSITELTSSFDCLKFLLSVSFTVLFLNQTQISLSVDINRNQFPKYLFPPNTDFCGCVCPRISRLPIRAVENSVPFV